MYFADYHTHSRLSPDGSAPLAELAQCAVAAGMDELCITDHYDLLTFSGATSPDYDWSPAVAQFRETVPQFAGTLKLKLGIEFGSGHLDLARSAALLALPELDFVIGSLHNHSLQQGGTDFFKGVYSSEDICYRALDDYFALMEEFVRHPLCYDVLGHIIYPLRYMARDGQTGVTLARYEARIDAILAAVVDCGRGIELNTWRGQSIEAWAPILKRFLAHGGDRITLGSDAHFTNCIAAGIREGQELLRSLGYRYFTTYEKREPIFIKL